MPFSDHDCPVLEKGCPEQCWIQRAVLNRVTWSERGPLPCYHKGVQAPLFDPHFANSVNHSLFSQLKLLWNIICLPEFLPYRRVDWTAQRDEKTHVYFCSHGYVCVRVDIRGSGDSEGFYYDEYEKQEQDDCCDVINWISQQKWCTGNVGKSSLDAKNILVVVHWVQPLLLLGSCR